jgi:hypothetical protein
MESLANTILYGFGVIFSLGLFIVSLRSYQKTRNKKILFVSLVLLVFLIKFAVLSASLFHPPLKDTLSIMSLGFFDVIMLVLLFVAILTKS